MIFARSFSRPQILAHCGRRLRTTCACLFSIEPKARRREGVRGNYRLYGDGLAVKQNQPNGVTFVYYLKNAAPVKITLTVTDVSGKTIRTLIGATKAGLNRVVIPLVEFGQFVGERSRNAPPPIAAGGYFVAQSRGIHM